jgi:hypothetical protein
VLHFKKLLHFLYFFDEEKTMAKKQIGNVLAATVGVLFATSSFASATNGAMDTMDATNSVKCMGANACKGETACKTPDNASCKGQNSCKGKGFIMVASEQECTDKGGKVEK